MSDTLLEIKAGTLENLGSIPFHSKPLDTSTDESNNIDLDLSSILLLGGTYPVDCDKLFQVIQLHNTGRNFAVTGSFPRSKDKTVQQYLNNCQDHSGYRYIKNTEARTNRAFVVEPHIQGQLQDLSQAWNAATDWVEDRHNATTTWLEENDIDIEAAASWRQEVEPSDIHPPEVATPVIIFGSWMLDLIFGQQEGQLATP